MFRARLDAARYQSKQRCCPRPKPTTRTTTASFLALLAEQKIGEADRANGTGPFGRDFRSIPNRDFQAAYRALEKAADTSGRQTAGSAPTGVFSARWRVSSQTLFVDAGNLDAGPAEFQFSGLQARSVEIRVVNIGNRPATVSGRCDGQIARSGGQRGRRRQHVRLNLAPAETPGSSAVLHPGPDLNRCELTVRSQGTARRLTILREEIADPELAASTASTSAARRRTPPACRRWSASFMPAASCPRPARMPVGKPKLLLDERDGFNAKVEALAGSRLPDSFFDARRSRGADRPLTRARARR